jgi:hypothetical protein
MNLLLCFLESDFYRGGYTWPVSSLYMNGKWIANPLDAVGFVTADRPWATGARPPADVTFRSERHFEALIDDMRVCDVPLSEDGLKTFLERETTTEISFMGLVNDRR